MGRIYLTTFLKIIDIHHKTTNISTSILLNITTNFNNMIFIKNEFFASLKINIVII